MRRIPVVDVFAGPGGLNEGFSRVAGDGVAFETALSIEMDPVACRTLRLRSVVRQLRGTPQIDLYYDYVAGRISTDEFRADPSVAKAFERADQEVLELELGPETRSQSNAAIASALGENLEKDWILIGGPPCQAYSLAGRSRRANDESFHEDKKHFLYREYLAILQEFRPSVFVMENVKGLLSSTHSDSSMFARIIADLKNPKPGLTYEIRSLAVDKDDIITPSDFVLKAEEFGIPQKRHRVILVGIRSDTVDRGFRVSAISRSSTVTVEDAIFDLPRLRSGITPKPIDTQLLWNDIRNRAAQRNGFAPSPPPETRGAAFSEFQSRWDTKNEYTEWVGAPKLSGVLQHEARSHMQADLERYFHIAASAARTGVSPKLSELPTDLLPKHRNATSASRPFEDRFRVQVASAPSTTVVSHISKDGHYYIHPDPNQMRSLTVREAARLQTFPDDYFFEGNRTQQYHQVGNAVPPLLAWKIGNSISAGFALLQAVAD